MLFVERSTIINLLIDHTQIVQSRKCVREDILKNTLVVIEIF